jgi:hypothetical protein
MGAMDRQPSTDLAGGYVNGNERGMMIFSAAIDFAPRAL